MDRVFWALSVKEIKSVVGVILVLLIPLAIVLSVICAMSVV